MQGECGQPTQRLLSTLRNQHLRRGGGNVTSDKAQDVIHQASPSGQKSAIKFSSGGQSRLNPYWNLKLNKEKTQQQLVPAFGLHK